MVSRHPRLCEWRVVMPRSSQCAAILRRVASHPQGRGPGLAISGWPLPKAPGAVEAILSLPTKGFPNGTPGDPQGPAATASFRAEDAADLAVAGPRRHETASTEKKGRRPPTAFVHTVSGHAPPADEQRTAGTELVAGGADGGPDAPPTSRPAAPVAERRELVAPASPLVPCLDLSAAVPCDDGGNFTFAHCAGVRVHARLPCRMRYAVRTLRHFSAVAAKCTYAASHRAALAQAPRGTAAAGVPQLSGATTHGRGSSRKTSPNYDRQLWMALRRQRPRRRHIPMWRWLAVLAAMRVALARWSQNSVTLGAVPAA
jgi:hypothetical protein